MIDQQEAAHHPSSATCPRSPETPLCGAWVWQSAWYSAGSRSCGESESQSRRNEIPRSDERRWVHQRVQLVLVG